MPRLPPELSSALNPSKNDPIDRLGQASEMSGIDGLGCGEWTILYEYQNTSPGSRCTYSGLLSPAMVVEALKQDGWGIFIGGGTPGFSQRHDDGREVVTYDRFGMSGIEPILFVRNFHGIKPKQFDLSEEFRLFHNLYHDRPNDRYLHIDDRGNEVVAAEVTNSRVRVPTRLLRQYMAARQLALVIFFDHCAEGKVDIETAKVASPNKKVVTADRRYSFHIGEVDDSVCSRLIGKKIIGPPPQAQCGVWPYDGERHDRYAEFEIGTDSIGSPIMQSCGPDALANYFGANEAAPHYLTPVWFARDVLTKYYADTTKFSIEDGYLQCGSLWGIRIDNNLPDHVVAYLGDLGRDLHYEEQLYWKHYNVASGGRSPSGANFQRSFLAEFADPTAPDLLFKQNYTQLIETWTKTLGWPLFRPLHESDAHIFKQLRVPISENLGEFEKQLLYLAKLLVDSLNDAELALACGGALVDEKSISKLKRYFELQKYRHANRDIGLLRTLQELRSSGAAHAKGKQFDKIHKQVGLDRDSPPDVFRRLLAKANLMLTDLSAHFILVTE
jgi:hypothetical protein